jgi:hypothetical protein
MNHLNIDRNKELAWKEAARWLKFVEVVEASGRWSKPCVATISNLGLVQLRQLITDGVLLMDCQERTLDSFIGTI